MPADPKTPSLTTLASTADENVGRTALPSPMGTLGRFQLHEELGRGSFGVVYRAYDPTLQRVVALKAPRFAQDQQQQLERFLREAQAAARLQHPNIVAVYDCGLAEGALFIAMEFVDGQPLSSRLTEGKPSPRQAAQWARDLALALHAAHEQGLLHRDVKPANIMIDRNHRARLMDFGLAKQALPSVAAPPVPDGSTVLLTHEGAIVGTPAYMAPEQARGDAAALGPHSDQFSLGVVLYEMLTAVRPWEGSLQQLLANISDPAQGCDRPRLHDPALSLGLEAIVLKTLSKDPAARYASLAELAIDLQRWLKGEPVLAPFHVQGDLLRRCPECGRSNRGTKDNCLYCHHDLRGVEPEDSALPASAPAQDQVAPASASSRRLEESSASRFESWPTPAPRRSTLLISLVVLALGLIGFLLWNFFRLKERTPAIGFWESIPLLGQTGDFGRGVAVGVGVTLAVVAIVLRSRR